MNVGVYLCRCGLENEGQISAKIDLEALRLELAGVPDVAWVEIVDFACSEAGQATMVAHLVAHEPDRVVVAACSPREHESTFKNVLRQAGMNPWLVCLVNVREHVAWVTEDRGDARRKALAQIRAGVARVVRQEPLETTALPVCADVLVIGGGPAGLKAALALAEAGRRVTLVEKSPILGGLPVRMEEVSPRMECAPCLLEPLVAEALHGEHAGTIDVLLTSEVVGLKGSFGNFDVQIRTDPRHVAVARCLGCGECITACPTSAPDALNGGRTTRKAIDFALFGGLPNAPVLDAATCTRTGAADDCTLCRDACPVEETIVYEDTAAVVERAVGAIIVAVGAELYDLARLPNLGYGQHPDVLSSWDVERMLANNGSTGGMLATHDGREPRTIAIVHCAGSLDAEHVPYCSGICCQSAFKYVHLIGTKHPAARVVSFYKTLVAAGKDAHTLYRHAVESPQVRMVHYGDVRELSVRVAGDAPLAIVRRDEAGREDAVDVDLVVLVAPLVLSRGAGALARMLDAGVDAAGFFAAHHPTADATRSRVRGIYVAGACQSPMDVEGAMTQGTAASGYVLAALVEGRTLPLDPVVAEVDAARCSGCRTCVGICPYKAIGFDVAAEVAAVTRALCAGCGTCAAACPTGAMHSHHFSDAAIRAEIEALLA